MVAIQSPSVEREWASRPRPSRPVPAQRRHLPDRATRVRRRRLAVLVLAVVVAGGLWLGVQALVSLTRAGSTTGPEPLGSGPGTAPVAGQTYVVRPGDTLWSIAGEVAPGSDPRPVVDALRAANGDAALEVGDVLTLEVD